MPRTTARPRTTASALKRHWLGIAVLTIVVTAIAGLFAYQHSNKYQATATVLVRPLIGNAFSTTTSTTSDAVDVALQTESGLVSSNKVVLLANASGLNANSTDVSATGGTGTQLVQITFTADSSAGARHGANVFADAFLAYRRDLAIKAVDAQVSLLTSSQARLQKELAAAQTLAAKKNAPKSAQSQVSQLSSQIGSLTSQINQAKSTPTQPGLLTAPAISATGGAWWLAIAITLAAALVAIAGGGLIALWIESRKDTIYATYDPAPADVPILGLIPGLEWSPPVREAFRVSATSMLAIIGSSDTADGQRGLPITVAPLTGSEPATMVARRLASALANAGYGTTLVDAGVHERRIGDVLGLPPTAGLSEVLLKDRNASELLVEVGRFRMLPAGTSVSLARDRYAGEQFKSVLARLAADADYVVVYGSAASTADGLAVACATQRVILVINDTTTTHAQLLAARQELERLNVSVVGAIAVRPGKGAAKAPASAKPDSGEKDGRRRRAKDTTKAAKATPTDQPGTQAPETTANPATPDSDADPPAAEPDTQAAAKTEPARAAQPEKARTTQPSRARSSQAARARASKRSRS